MPDWVPVLIGSFIGAGVGGWWQYRRGYSAGKAWALSVMQVTTKAFMDGYEQGKKR